MRVEQHVTFAWEVNADEDAVICAALRMYALHDERAEKLLRERSPVLDAVARGKALSDASIVRKLPDVDLLAEQEVETPS